MDARLLAILERRQPLDGSSLQRAAMLESARGAVLRLLAAAEAEEAGLERPQASPD